MSQARIMHDVARLVPVQAVTHPSLAAQSGCRALAVAASDASPGPGPILYGFWHSTCTWRVRAVLAAAGEEYEYCPVNLMKGAQRSHEYVRINSMASVPTWVEHIEGAPAGKSLVLTQSMAIAEHIIGTRSAARHLLPEDPVKRAQARQISQIVSSDIQPFQQLRAIQAVAESCAIEGSANSASVSDPGQAFARRMVTRGMEALEHLLQSTAGEHAVGNVPTLADAFIAPQVGKAEELGIDVSTLFPRSVAVRDAILSSTDFSFVRDTRPHLLRAHEKKIESVEEEPDRWA